MERLAGGVSGGGRRRHDIRGIRGGPDLGRELHGQPRSLARAALEAKRASQLRHSLANAEQTKASPST
jgi:hypothetical protein